MRVEVRADGVTIYTFRQSWISTFLQCPDQARLDMLSTEPSVPTDAAAIGTACHEGIEERLKAERDEGYIMSVDEMIDISNARFVELAHQGINWVQGTEKDAAVFIPNAMQAWVDYIGPYVRVTPDLLLEHNFNVLLDEGGHRGGAVLRLSGTMDCFDGRVRDWKTANQKYVAWEKQRWAVQPTVYSYAAVALGLAEWPVEFEYGVMMKRKTQVYAERIPVTRDVGHIEWLKRMLWRIVDLYELFGPDRAWPLNDQDVLCSDKWCPFWDRCKGRFVTGKGVSLETPFLTLG